MTEFFNGAIIFLIIQVLAVTADKPCWNIYLKENRSSVCMCTAQYCDEVTRDTPGTGKYIYYASSEAGLRFKKTVENLQTFYYRHPENACPAKNHCSPAFLLNPRTLYQTIEGFGGAVTDAASINWDSLEDEQLKQKLVDSYFSKQGIEYNMMRVPMGGSDFSTRPYAYNELPADDFTLSNFTLAPEDFNYKLPMIKRCFKAATTDVHIVASLWSPPTWMKTNHKLTLSSYLKEECYQVLADYFLKFLESYAKEGVPVWAVTTTNEPTNVVLDDMLTFNSLGWIVHSQGKWIANNLGPTIKNSSFSDCKILCMDDERHFLPSFFNGLIFEVPEALQYIDGVAVHMYYDERVPPEMITYSMRDHPDKFIISTEGSTGIGAKDNVDFGSWPRAQTYIRDIIENLNFNVTGWIDWNMCLDEQGGPNWNKNFVDAPIIVSNDKNKFYKQPIFYALGQVSKFVPRGSRRIEVTTLCEGSVQNVAFLTPENTVVTVLHNTGEAIVVHLVTCNRLAKVPMERNSIVTVEFLHEQC